MYLFTLELYFARPGAVFESAQKRDSTSIKSASSISDELVRERKNSSRKPALARPHLRLS